MIVKAIVTTLDNLENLQDTVMVLRDEPLDEIIIVNNGSQDSTREWLDEQDGLMTIHRENLGAGPGRNAGLDAAGKFDYVLMLDGGIRPLRGTVEQMMSYLDTHPNTDVIGVEIQDLRTDKEQAWRRWINPITDANTYCNTRLSHTAYCMCRANAWNGLRFCEDGPFGEPGWGADDDEMAYQWHNAGIVVYVVTCACKNGQSCNSVHPYRRASGSFQRLYRETGIWPNQYGSVYEKRVVWLQQNWPQYEPGMQWGEPWLTVIIRAGEVKQTAKLIKSAHDRLLERRFIEPYDQWPNPYSIIVCDASDEFLQWAEPRRLRQHHGSKIIIDGEIIRRTSENEDTWTGDFRICKNCESTIRPNAYYYGIVSNENELSELISIYDRLHPRQPVKNPPGERRQLL